MLFRKFVAHNGQKQTKGSPSLECCELERLTFCGVIQNLLRGAGQPQEVVNCASHSDLNCRVRA